ncbi:hypothetical protein Tco_1427022 [Tanacetum coccineum]
MESNSYLKSLQEDYAARMKNLEEETLSSMRTVSGEPVAWEDNVIDPMKTTEPITHKQSFANVVNGSGSRRNNTKVQNMVSGSKVGDGVHQDKKDDDYTFWDMETQVYGNLNLGNSNSAPAPKSSFVEVITEKPVRKSMFKTLLNDKRVESADVVLSLATLMAA